MNFASDNIVGASAPVLEALMRANEGPMPAYGSDDDHRQRRGALRRDLRARRRGVPVTTGTAANALALSAAVPPWGLASATGGARHRRRVRRAGILHARRQAHGPAGSRRQARRRDVSRPTSTSLPEPSKQMPPKALSISQVTECGTVYALDEIAALGGGVPASTGWLPHGRRALRQRPRALGCTPAEMTWKAGRRHPVVRRHQERLPDGGSHRGLRPGAAEAWPTARKRAGQIDLEGPPHRGPARGLFRRRPLARQCPPRERMATRLSEGLARLARRAARLADARPTRCFRSCRSAIDKALRDGGRRLSSAGPRPACRRASDRGRRRRA